MQIDSNLIKQVEGITTWFFALPQKILSATLGTQEVYFRRRERIQKQRELAEIREVGKLIQSLYFSKGSLLLLANAMQMDRDTAIADEFRTIFGSIANSIDGIWEAISETPISNLSLGAEISTHLGLTKATYNSLCLLPDEAILDDRRLLEIIRMVEQMQEVGSLILLEVDQHRLRLDSTYGNGKT
jgi:hypothetical protein